MRSLRTVAAVLLWAVGVVPALAGFDVRYPDYAAPGQGAPQPRVSPGFRSEIGRLAAEGLELKEALETDLELGARLLAAVFARGEALGWTERYELRMLLSDGRASETLFRRSEFFFSFAGLNEMAKLNATDINGDGIKEIIVQSSSGGNCWSCNPTEIYQVRNRKCVLVAAAPLQKIADLDSDGVQELVVTDARWEVYDELSHASSPFAAMVYAWRDGRYAYASPDFSQYYEGEINRLRAAVARAAGEVNAGDFSDDEYVGLSISLCLTFAHMGEHEKGLKELEVLMTSNIGSAEESKRRAAVVDDFRNGPSARKLRELKYGNPMQLG